MAEQFEPVKLRSPGGDLYTAHTARELNDLVYGHGYTIVGMPTGTATSSEAPTATKSAPAKKEGDRG